MKTLVITSFAVLLIGLAPVSYASESFDSVMGEAKSNYQKADKLQGAWVSTKKLINKAQAAKKKGDKKQALKMAKKARHEAQQSLAQARDQQKNWSEPAYIKR